ncbi:zf-C2HC5-domain-containing protein [Tuber magnatum]|uniref:Zf-C2HC5-domain-containing protein n=1 Tax=Tuber magnatum TaxID=42249 RepID=A0A317SYC3_9PEZI|nr:zf-C2HC5-domain-containing protein [Tuber magnatum]
MSSKSSIGPWALTRLEPLLPLPEDSLKEVISYALSLTDACEVSSHFEGLLGSAEEALNFISDFNSRLFPQRAMRAPTIPHASSSGSSANVPPAKRRGKKGKLPINQYANQLRQVEGQFGNPAAVYMKKDIEDEYYTGGGKGSTSKPVDSPPPSSSAPASRATTPIPRSTTPQPVQKKVQQSSSSNVGGKLVSDLINVKAKVKKAPQKVHVTGGVAMRGASAELTDLEAALRALELSTNPTLTSESQKCNCAGMKHEVLSAAPNCLSCGKIICIKEGLAPCSFCNTPLIPPAELQSMIRELREESGREKMAMSNAMHKRPEVARAPKPFSSYDITPGTSDDEGLKRATEHRDRLLGFQATSAQRTKIIDQAADFETPVMGSNMWATPQERALQLKKQQKAMREMEWSAKEDYEKRRMVVEIDLKGRQVVRRMQEIERPREDSDEGAIGEEAYDDTLERGGTAAASSSSASKGGTYSHNPLLKGMIRPVYDSSKGKGKEGEKTIDAEPEGYVGGLHGWRRVQVDFADYERVTLDGDIGGEERGTQGDEPACG